MDRQCDCWRAVLASLIAIRTKEVCSSWSFVRMVSCFAVLLTYLKQEKVNVLLVLS